MKTKLFAPVIFFALLVSFSFTLSEHATKRYISVKLASTHQIANNGVGHDWDNFLSVNRQVIRKGEQITLELKNRAPLTIEAHSIEEDENYSDVGKNTMTFTYSDLIAIEKSRFEIRVKVMENGGQNAGNLAEWMFIFELAKIVK